MEAQVRSVDEPEKFRGLGEKVTKPAPAPASPSPKPQGAYGVITGADGRLRTTKDNLPKIVESMLPEGCCDVWGFLP